FQSELIISKGYPVEEYDVVTEDGYVIAIQRIPRGRTENQNATWSNKKTIFLQHGMFGASSDYVINFPNQSLGFILADAGYDVWMGNSRGNTYSRHVNLTKEDRKFWDFSADEVAAIDLPSMIDTVLKITGKQEMQYVGWSQGALVMLALLSWKPEYNKKISLFSAMGPVPYLGHVRAPVRLLAPISGPVATMVKMGGKGQLLLNTPFMKNAANNLCSTDMGNSICTFILFLITGVDSKQLNKTRLPVYFSHDPAGTSVNNVLQLTQLMRCDCFRKFDYGIIRNMVKYGKLKPPPYILSHVTAPVAIYWSKGDWFAAEKDVAHLRKDLSNVVEYYQVPEEEFTHFDFGWGINAEPILYRPMMRKRKKLNSCQSAPISCMLFFPSFFTMNAYPTVICLAIFLLLTKHSFSQKVAIDPDSLRNVSELITSKGYPVEEYEVVTKDGYVLAVQRIPRGKNESPDAEPANKTTIFLEPGFLGSSSDYVLNFPNQSIGFILADSGYDVWIGNFRGNTYSSHVNLTKKDRKFWEFSADEIATIDLPTMIDTVLKLTGKEKIQYLGWSQGALVMFALLSSKPEYNKKITLFSAMGPVPYLGHLRGPARIAAPLKNIIAAIFEVIGKGGLLLNTPAIKLVANTFCTTKVGNNLCTIPFFLLSGMDAKQLNKSRMPVYLSHEPAGVSVNNFLQLMQLIQCNCFQKFNYGVIKNMAKYGQPKPPPYILSHVTAPVAIYWSQGDWLATTKDVARLRDELSNVVNFYEVPEKQFTHLDFGLGINAGSILYQPMMSVMNKYRE
ncbi:unnamed protein product, partial [Ixodes hexagonus]